MTRKPGGGGSGGIGKALALLFLLLFPAILPAAGESLEGGVNPGYHEPPSWFKQSFLELKEDVAEAAAAGKRVLLYFYQDGCPYCARLLRDNFGNRHIAEKTRKAFDVIAINIWGDREVTDLQGRSYSEKRFAAALKVQYTPTLIFLDEEGRVVARLNGYYPPHKFEVVLDYVAGHHEKEQTLAAYYRKRNPVPASGKLHAESFFLSTPLDLSRRPPGKHLAVLFEQRACKACDELHGDLLKRKAVLEALSPLDVAQVDLWSKEKLKTPDGRELTADRWAAELGVQYAPTWVFFDDRGKEVFRIEAWVKAFHLEGVLDYVATGGYRWQPSLQRFLQRRADILHAKGFEVDLMK